MLPALPSPGPDGRYSAEQVVTYGQWVAARAVAICANAGLDMDQSTDIDAGNAARTCAHRLQHSLCTNRHREKVLRALQGIRNRLQEYRDARHSA